MKISTVKKKLTVAQMAELFSAKSDKFKVKTYEAIFAHNKDLYTYKITVEHNEIFTAKLLIQNWFIADDIPGSNLFIGDLSIPELSIYRIPDHWDVDRIEEFMTSKGHKVSDCIWGAFEGEIKDYR